MQDRGSFAHPERITDLLGIEPGMKVADFGAGSGVFVFAVAQRLTQSGIVYAIDVQKDLLRRITTEAARAHIRNIETIWADLEVPGASKLKDASLDLVIISNVLFQLVDKKPPLREALRILKPKGRLVIIDWEDSFRHMGPAPEDVVTRDAALELARSTGFSIVKEFDAGSHHYGLIFHPGT